MQGHQDNFNFFKSWKFYKSQNFSMFFCFLIQRVWNAPSAVFSSINVLFTALDQRYAYALEPRPYDLESRLTLQMLLILCAYAYVVYRARPCWLMLMSLTSGWSTSWVLGRCFCRGPFIPSISLQIMSHELMMCFGFFIFLQNEKIVFLRERS